MDCSTPVLSIHHQLPEPTQTHVHWVGDAIQPSHPLSSPSPPAPNPSQHQGLFQWVNSSHEVSKVLEFQLQHQSFRWILRTDFLQDGLVISLQSKGLSRVFSNISSKVSILECSAFFMAHLSYLYMTTEQAIGLTIRIFVSKMMSLFFNTVSRFVIAFPTRRNNLLISWLQSPYAVILKIKKIKICHCFQFFPFYLPWLDGTVCLDLSFLNAEF